MRAVDLLVLGAGGFGRSVADAAAASGQFRVAGFVDDRGPELGLVLGIPVLGRSADLPRLRQAFEWLVVAIGDNARRRNLARQARHAGFTLATVVHPQAWASRYAMLGAGSMVMAGAIVGTEAELGEGVIVNATALVDHHARVGEYGHLGVGARMAGGAFLGPYARLDEGMVLRAGERRTLPGHDAVERLTQDKLP